MASIRSDRSSVSTTRVARHICCRTCIHLLCAISLGEVATSNCWDWNLSGRTDEVNRWLWTQSLECHQSCDASRKAPRDLLDMDPCAAFPGGLTDTPLLNSTSQTDPRRSDDALAIAFGLVFDLWNKSVATIVQVPVHSPKGLLVVDSMQSHLVVSLGYFVPFLISQWRFHCTSHRFLH